MTAIIGRVVFRSSRSVRVQVGAFDESGDPVQDSSAVELWECDLRGRMRIDFEEAGIAVGDLVSVEPTAVGAGCVSEVLPRRNRLCRRREVGGGRELVLAANVDQVLAIFSARRPRPKFAALDRLLVACESQGLPARIAVNKIDLGVDEELAERFELYPALGYPLHMLSVQNSVGVEELARALAGRVTVVSGPSGVGKSSLLNALIPGLRIAVSEVSEHNEKGKHTTSAVAWYDLEQGGAIIDTPGFRQFALWGLGQAEIAAAFPELRDFVGACRFADCKHEVEPGCRIAEAAEAGKIDRRRYDSFRHICREP